MKLNNISKQKILIVDDEPQNIKILGEALTLNYDIYIATRGENAIQVAQVKNPDIILLDIMMPGLSGFDVLKKLKIDPLTAKIPVIFITSMDSEEDEAKGLEIGAVDYITKPFSLPIVRARVKTHLELKRNRDILEYYALYDGLTGVFSRRRFDELLPLEWNRCLRYALPISLIMIDIDHFKLYNDHYGHPAGDVCLKNVAQAMASVMKRSSDFLARYGGEEFVAVLAGTDIEGAKVVAEIMQTKIRELNIPHEYSLVAKRITISMGISGMNPTKENSMAELVETADKALYRAKSEGRNRYHLP